MNKYFSDRVIDLWPLLTSDNIWEPVESLNVVSDGAADPGGAISAIAPLETYESNFIHHDFVQCRNEHWRYKVILPSTVLSQQCCEVCFIFLTVVNPYWDLSTKYCWNCPPWPYWLDPPVLMVVEPRGETDWSRRVGICCCTKLWLPERCLFRFKVLAMQSDCNTSPRAFDVTRQR